MTNTMNEYKKEDVIAELTAGICEIIFTDSFSVEHKVSVTLSPNHIDGAIHQNVNSSTHISAWDMVEENWNDIVLSSIIDLERLTGPGIKGDSKIVNLNDISFL